MHVRILGSAAGGGVPQWNCRCRNCESARSGIGAVRPRTQSSLAVRCDARSWLLLNASPDIRQQILSFPELGPAEGQTRGHSIAGCVLTDAELDHTAGLLFLREGGPFTVFCTGLVRRWLNRHFPIEPVLQSFARPTWTELPLDAPITCGAGLEIRAFEVDRHVPRFVDAELADAAGSVIGLHLHDRTTGGKLLYVPCLGSLSESVRKLANKVDAIFIDGTFWSDDEPLAFGTRTALQMGHLPVSGPHGSLGWLSELPVRHRVYVHINNTNPMLDENGPEHRQVIDSGVHVGTDGDSFEFGEPGA